LIAVTDAFDNITTIERDADGHPTSIIAPGGQTTGLQVNPNGYLSAISCPYNFAIQLEYTAENLLTKFVDLKGGVHQFTYDPLGRLIKDEDPAGGFTELTRAQLTNGYKVDVTTAEGRNSTYQVNYLSGIGVRRTDTDAAGAVTISQINYDGSIKVTYPDGTVITTATGPDPRPGMGVRVPMTREFTITTPAGLKGTIIRERTVEYETEKPQTIFNISKIVDTVTSNGIIYTTTYDIDAEAQTVTETVTTPSGLESAQQMDWHGRLTKLSQAGLAPVTYTYDAKGHLTGVQQGTQSITLTYDDMNRITALTDAAGDSFGYTYNNADVLKTITMPGGEVYGFKNDLNGNVTEITMPNSAVHTLDYTPVNLASSYTPPGNASYLKSYDLDRSLTSLSLPGGRAVVFTYDPSGRVTGMSYDLVNSSFGYADSTNRVSSIQRDPDGVSYNYLYDGSLITQLTAGIGGSINSYSYRYNNDFNLLGVTLDDNLEVSMGYDANGQLNQYGAFSITREGPAGVPSQISDGVMTTVYTYDNEGRPKARTTSVAGSQIYGLGLDYDTTGLIKNKTETAAASVSAYAFTYDDNKQLTRVSGASSESYTYDSHGNRLSGDAAYDTQDRLTNLGYQFNEDGFLAQRNTDRFEYTAQGELRKATLSDRVITYIYDGLGRRVGRTATSNGEEPVITTEHYLYGNLQNPVQVTAMRDNAGVLSEYYYDQYNCLIAVKKGLDWYYVATDQQGTPKVISDATGAIVKTIQYDSFGRLITDTNPLFQLAVGYSGGIADPDTGLVHFGMRDYDPQAGRWTARDPILFDGHQANLYVYVNNNPVNLRDPSGLFCIGGSAYAGVGGGGQLCITGEGVSVCAEVGFGIGTSVEINPIQGLANTSSEIGMQAGFGVGPLGTSGEFVLDDCGNLKFNASAGLGPVSTGSSYDFLEGKWSTTPLGVGIDPTDYIKGNDPPAKSAFKASGKLYGKKCLRI
jgi:RHS repeat-associated protein